MQGLKEANIVINGVPLTMGQSMTMRVALESFASELNSEGLGNDEMGKKITEGYLNNIDEIRKAIYK